MTHLEELRAALDANDQRTVERLAVQMARILDRSAKVTWLTPIEQAYDAEMGAGSFPIKQAARVLAPRYKHHGSDTIAAHLGFYLRGLKRNEEVKYLSLSRFVQTFAEHDPNEMAFDDEPV